MVDQPKPCLTGKPQRIVPSLKPESDLLTWIQNVCSYHNHYTAFSFQVSHHIFKCYCQMARISSVSSNSESLLWKKKIIKYVFVIIIILMFGYLNENWTNEWMQSKPNIECKFEIQLIASRLSDTGISWDMNTYFTYLASYTIDVNDCNFYLSVCPSILRRNFNQIYTIYIYILTQRANPPL